MINKIEALVDAISHLKGSSTNPDGELYQIRNPLGLVSFSLPGKNEINSEGLRVFKSWSSGYHAACYDAGLKIKGESRAGIKKDDLLENLLRVYGFADNLAHRQVVKFLRRALKDQSIAPETPLSYFREEK